MNYAGRIRIIMPIIVVVVIAIVGTLLFMFVGNPKWEAFDKNEQYKGFFDNTIIEMELRKPIDSGTQVCFTDKDLISEWENFFNTLEIKQERSESIYREDPHDEGILVRVKTKSSNYDFLWPIYSLEHGKLVMKIGEDYYDFRSNKNFDELFDQVYGIAVERYGEVTLPN